MHSLLENKKLCHMFLTQFTVSKMLIKNTFPDKFYYVISKQDPAFIDRLILPY